MTCAIIFASRMAICLFIVAMSAAVYDFVKSKEND